MRQLWAFQTIIKATISCEVSWYLDSGNSTIFLSRDFSQRKTNHAFFCASIQVIYAANKGVLQLRK